MPNYYSYDLKNKIIQLHLQHNYSVLNLSNLFNISKSSIYNWITLYNSNNLLINKKNYIKNNSIFRNIIIRSIIKIYISNDSNFMYHKLISFIYDKTFIHVSKSTLYDIIHDLNFTKKIVKLKKYHISKNKTINNISHLQNKIKPINQNNIISIDEISFDTNIINNKAWSLKGNIITKNIKSTYKRITVICAITNNKILHYHIIKNSSDSNIFLNFISNMFNKLDNINQYYLLLDNASIHHSKIFQKYINDNHINVIYNVPYSPEFNPIELMFSKLKKLVKEFNNNFELNYLTNNIISSFNHITSSNLFNYFKHSFNILFNI